MAALVQLASRGIDSSHWDDCSFALKSGNDRLVLELQALLGGNFGEGTAGFALNGEGKHCREVAAEDAMDIEMEAVDVRTSFNSLK